MFLKIIKLIRLIVFISILTVGGCTQLLWVQYRDAYQPCQTKGEQLGYIDIAQLAPAGSNYPALCSAKRDRRYFHFRAR